MYIVPHPVLESYLELCEKGRVDKEFSESFLDTFLRALAIFGLPSHIIKLLRRNFCIVGSSTEDAGQGVHDLETLLRRHDLVLGSDLGGLGNLFRSAIENNDVSEEKQIDFNGLDASLKNQLRPIEDALSMLWALDDIQDALSLSEARVSSCIVMSALSQCVAKEKLTAFLSERSQLSETCRLFHLENRLNQIDARFVNNELLECDLRAFSLWLLVHYVERKIELEPLQKRLVDTLLKKVKLGSLTLYDTIRAG